MDYEQARVTHVYADDWEGVYINGVISDQGHSIGFGNILISLVGKTLKGYHSFKVNDKWLLAESGWLPDALADVVGWDEEFEDE